MSPSGKVKARATFEMWPQFSFSLLSRLSGVSNTKPPKKHLNHRHLQREESPTAVNRHSQRNALSRCQQSAEMSAISEITQIRAIRATSGQQQSNSASTIISASATVLCSTVQYYHQYQYCAAQVALPDQPKY